uniref:Putative ATPase domain containing protein n=1 Tax=viral metagenome TaxID=1070528 RepID=A0A6M3M4I1_9ZZZZ
MTEPKHIVSLKAQNLMNLTAVEIQPKGNTVVISGKNAAGKSNVLRAIEFALSGKALKAAPEPVRHGEKSGEIILDLGDIIVTRKFTNERSTLVIENKDGVVFKSPQALLDKFRGNISFDPLEFSRLPEKQQMETLLELIDLPIDLDKLDQNRKKLYDERTAVNRSIKELEGQISGLNSYQDVPEDELSAVDVMDELQAATQQIATNQRNKDRLMEYINTRDRAYKKLETLESEMNEIKRNIAAFTLEIDSISGEINAMIDPDLEIFKCKLEDVETINNKIRQNNSKKALVSRMADKQAVSNRLSFEILSIDDLKEQTIEEANMPIQGLGFNETGVTFDNIPLSQCSSAEQKKISVAIGMAINPELRVLWISDASLLDHESIEQVKAMAIEHDYQLFLELVDESGKLGIVIEDGAVVAVN